MLSPFNCRLAVITARKMNGPQRDEIYRKRIITYGVTRCGRRYYKAGQKEHHRKISFRDEFILFLKANGIEYDERYL